MKFTDIAVSLITLGVASTLGSAHVIDNQNANDLHARQSGKTFTTTGSGTAIYPRLELRQMQAQQPNQYTLLILALQAWQQESQTSQTSYFGVSRIHGVPDENYNGVGQCGSCGDADGYCTHNSVLFPAWHRVYVALYEQQFLARVNTIASQFTGSQAAAMQQAASTMRWPYWDWAANPPNNGHNVPSAVTQQYVTVTSQTGSPITVPNPLYTFNFTQASLNQLGGAPFTGWPQTLRYPSSDSPNAYSDNGQMTYQFDQIQGQLQEQVYDMLRYCYHYLYFSNDVDDGQSPGCANSLEGIHNTVHVTAGGPGNPTGGHMAWLNVAAYDPMFWLHHANVDRLFALWQTLHPTSYGATQQAQDDTWTIASGSYQGANSNLTPFYKDSKSFWTTNQVRSWNTTFKYTYPEFADSAGDSAAILKYVKALYGPNANAVAGSSKRNAEPAPASTLSLPNPFTTANGSSYHYVATIKTPRYHLDGSYTIYLFSGSPASENPATYISDPKLIGPMGVLAHRGSMRMNDIMISGAVPLTRTLTRLVHNNLLNDLTEDVVALFLRANLKWRIVGPTGLVVDPTTLPGFVVSVAATTITESADPDQPPVLAPWTILTQATDGLVGGLTAAMLNLVGGLVDGLIPN